MEQIPFEDYINIDAVNASALKAMAVSPAHYKHFLESTKKSKAMVIGAASHAILCEGDPDAVAVLPPIDRRTKAGKEIYEAFIANNAGKIIISTNEMATIEGMRAGIKANRWARAILSKGDAEVSHVWLDNASGLMCKARFDRIYQSLIVDYKTTTDASPEAFQRSAISLGYHLQAAHYMADVPDAQFVFVVQEKEPPYAVACYEPGEDFIAYGREERARLMRRIIECQEMGEWPTYHEGVRPLYLPTWIKRR